MTAPIMWPRAKHQQQDQYKKAGLSGFFIGAIK
jgi:hypothetical protein